MPTAEVQIKTQDGVAGAHFATPEKAGPWPAIILYMDGLGIRPELVAMAERLSSHGYAVLLPNLYYRHGETGPIDFVNDRERVMQMVQSVTNAAIVGDTRAFLGFLDSQTSVAGPKIGAVGYCMGGALALTVAGRFPERVVAAASIHGARLATDAPDSPHLLAPKMIGEIYVGVSEIDPYLEPGETERLEAALKAAGTRQMVEIYPGVQHGFAPPGHGVYDRAASEHHWDQISALFARNLARDPE